MTIAFSADVIEGQFVEYEHRRLRAGLARLQDSIDEAHRLTRSAVAERVISTLAWLRRDVLPHAAWEDAWLYPHLDETAGTPWATRALRFEHEQIREVAAALESAFQALHDHWTTELSFELVIALTRLETLVSAHLAQEERFVTPLLDAAEHGHDRQTNGGTS
jgi:hemerythrin-like domain-containing protein